MNKLYFLKEQIMLNVPEGTDLLEAMRMAHMTPDAPCGGKGKCGKCTVFVRQGGNGSFEKVLACRTEAADGMEIDTGTGELARTEILTDASGVDQQEWKHNPFLTSVRVLIRPCPSGESIPDWDRFLEGLADAPGLPSPPECIMEKNGSPAGRTTGASGSYADFRPSAASKLGPLAKANGGNVYAVLFDGEVLDVCAEAPLLYMAAFDIGTTTVAGYLINAADGTVSVTDSCMNPQAKYGADVINRANYTLEHGMEEVSSCIRAALRDLLDRMARRAGISTENIYAVSVAGNTCMHHLFLGISPDSLVHAPYNPAISCPMILPASCYQLNIHPNGKLMMLPNIAGFVGADTVGCLVATRLAEQKEWTLLIDIGTNGEMVLGRNHCMAACSTAAGPAFEGAGITCGMRGSAGAISKVRWADGKWEYETIGNEPPRGICGSGLLDLAAQLLISGQMDETGQLENGPSVVLADEKESGTGEAVTLEQKDIRQLQLAKAAIASGIHLLAKKMGISLDEIKTVWLAGAFGSFLSPESACDIGLIPEALRGRIRAVGNAAGEGAKRVLQDKDQWEYANAAAKETAFLELASMPEFQDRFVDEILFPEQ